MAVAVETTPTFVKTGTPRDVMEMPIAASPLIGAYTYDVSRDGQRILAIVPVADAATSPITILTNWAAALRKEKK
jgi:hypothetical protein